MFYVQFSRICKDKGTSPSATLKTLGLSTSKLTAWKNGSIPNYKILDKLAALLSVSVQHFFVNDVYSQMDMELFFSIISFLCKSKGISFEYVFFECLHFPPRTIEHWKKGNVPSYKSLEKLSSYFCVSIDDLTGAFAHNFSSREEFFNSIVIHPTNSSLFFTSNINNSVFAQGHNSTVGDNSSIVVNGNSQNGNESDILLNIYQNLDADKKKKMLKFAFSLEE